MSFSYRLGNSFIRLPADAAGKRLGTNLYIWVQYTSLTLPLNVGDYINFYNTGDSSIKLVAEVVASYSTTVTDGYILVFPDDDSPTLSIAAGYQIRIGTTPHATVASAQIDEHVQKQVIVGKNNPTFGQNVDYKGSAYVRFDEGSQQLTAMGLTRTGRPSYVASLSYEYETESWQMQKITGSGANVTHNGTAGTAKISTTQTSGSTVTWATNKHFPYVPGWSNLFGTSVMLGDQGRANNIRRWGPFTDDDGVYFQMSGTELGLVYRRSGTGAVVETYVPQSQWNIDPVDGGDTSDSGFVLDTSYFNVYWFDFQLNGIGKIRCGIRDQHGVRTTVHEFLLNNNSVTPNFRNSALTMRYENFNLDTTSADSHIHVGTIAVIQDEGLGADIRHRSHRSSYSMSTPVTISGSQEVAIMSMRAGTTYGGYPNRMISVPAHYSTYTSGSCVLFRVRKNTGLSGSSFFSGSTASPVELDLSGTLSGTLGREVFGHYLGTGGFDDDFPESFDFRADCMTTKADCSAADVTWTVTAQTVNAAATASFGFGFQWFDVGC